MVLNCDNGDLWEVSSRTRWALHQKTNVAFSSSHYTKDYTGCLKKWGLPFKMRKIIPYISFKKKHGFCFTPMVIFFEPLEVDHGRGFPSWYLGSTPHPVTVANEGLQGFPIKNVIILVVTVSGWGVDLIDTFLTTKNSPIIWTHFPQPQLAAGIFFLEKKQGRTSSWRDTFFETLKVKGTRLSKMMKDTKVFLVRPLL